LRCTPRTGKGSQCTSEIDCADGVSEERIINHVKSVDPEGEVGLSRNDSGRFIATVDLQSCHACRILGDSGCLLDSAVSRPDGGIQWNIIAPTRGALTRLVEDLQAMGAEAVVENVMVLRTARELTAKQEETLRMAFDLGYFDTPKKINLDELAKRLNISKAVLDVMLRRAQRKIVASHIGDG
jgi:predicted DNA binding protein